MMAPALGRSWEMDVTAKWRDAPGVSAQDADGAATSAGVPTMEQIRRASEGSARDQRVVFEYVSPRVIGICKRILGSRHSAAEDAMQESLIGVLKGLDRIESADKLSAYAARIAVRTAIRTAKRTRKRRRDDDEVGREVGEQQGASPAATLLARRRKQLVREILAELPDEQSDAIAAQIVLGMSLEETADQLGVPVNTVRSRVRAAKEKMRKIILKTPKYKELIE